MSKQQPNRDVTTDTYDRNIVPAETAARMEREGESYKHTTEEEAADQADLDTDGGYTVDKEGLVNNFAIEPEMYIEEPGDLREKEEQLKAERAQEVKEVNQTDESGKLHPGDDERGKGTGVI